MSVLLRKKYESIKKEKLSDSGKALLKSMAAATNNFKDAKASAKIKTKFLAFFDKLKTSKPEAIKGLTAPKEPSNAKQFKEARERRSGQSGVSQKESDIEKDAGRPAISVKGKRVTDGKHYPYVKGNVYYEYRDNRYDKRPKKYPKLEDGGMMADGGMITIKSGNNGKLKEIFNREKNQRNEILANEIFDEEKLKGRSVFMMVDGEVFDSHIQESDMDEYADGGTMAKGGSVKEEIEIKGYTIKHIKNSYDDYWYFIYQSTPFEFETKEEAVKSLNGLIKTNPYADGGVTQIKMYFEPQKNIGGKSIQSDNEIRGNYRDMDIVLDKKIGNDYIGSNFYINDGYGVIYVKSEKAKDGVKTILNMFDFEDATSQYKTSKMADGGEMAMGGEPHRIDEIFAEGGTIAQGNNEMLESQLKAVEHHVKELSSILTKDTEVEAWVVGKIERAATDLSDITHYLDGRKFEDGGSVDSSKFYVAVSETKDGYWVVMSRPTHEKWVAESMIENVPRNEVGKVVTLDEARKHTKIIGKEYLTDDMIAHPNKFADGGMMAKGGFVSKGELVWRKLNNSKKSQFLKENFTPQITPRSQEILVGKDFQFLPKDVKIKLESKYANVEEYRYGGTMAKGGKLIGKQKNIDVNKNGKLDAEDFKLLRQKAKSRLKK